MAKKRAVEGRLGLSDMDAKHASLMQDYLQLQHEFGDLRDRLQATKLRKSFLSAEVRFLRRRLKKLKQKPLDLKGNSSEIPAFRLQIDLNESSIPNMVMEKARLVSALKTSGFRKKADSFVTEMAGKRKISWQDQISLECN